jgi:hypothetical protein
MKSNKNAQNKANKEQALKMQRVAEIEELLEKLTGARQTLSYAFALLQQSLKLEEPSNSDIHSQVIASLSESLAMVNHLTNTCDQLRTLTSGLRDLPSTTRAPKTLEEWVQVPLWFIDILDTED